MIRNTAHRQPKKSRGFSWGRFPIGPEGSAKGVEWRLFRRDHRGAVHFEMRVYPVDIAPAEVAHYLRRAKRLLRDRVDEVDLAALEVAA